MKKHPVSYSSVLLLTCFLATVFSGCGKLHDSDLEGPAAEGNTPTLANGTPPAYEDQICATGQDVGERSVEAQILRQAGTGFWYVEQNSNGHIDSYLELAVIDGDRMRRFSFSDPTAHDHIQVWTQRGGIMDLWRRFVFGTRVVDNNALSTTLKIGRIGDERLDDFAAGEASRTISIWAIRQESQLHYGIFMDRNLACLKV
jgi:hypothetical protein